MVFRRWPHSAKKLNSDVYMLLARSTCCLFVVGCILILDLIIRSQTSSRSDDVSPYLMVSCAAGAREKIPRTFAHRVPLFNLIVLSSLVCVGVLVYWCLGLCVHRGLPLSHHQRGTDFGREGGCALHPPLPAVVLCSSC